MKKYIQPAMAIYKVNVQSVLETTSLEISNDEVNGNQALSKRRHNRYNDWEDEQEWEDENEEQNGPTF